MKNQKTLSTIIVATIVSSSVTPIMAATTSNETIIGSNRHDTAVKISKDGWSSAETVILVNSSAIPDALTATPLAHAKNAPILLTGKDRLNKETADEIKRLGAKNVIMIGGDVVLPAKIEKDLKALKVKVDRIKGATREETALATAKRLDGIKDISEIAVVNGTTGLADAVSVAAAVAERNMPIILANPKKGLSVAEKFIKGESIKASFIIGGKTVLPEKLVSSLSGKQRIEGSNRNNTNAKVIEKFYADRNLDNLYLAKDGMGDSGQLIDALAVGALAAKNGAPVLIASKKLSETQKNIINTKRIDTITQVGGKGNEKAFAELKEIEKEVVIKVKTEAELQEALKKANANDVIEIEGNISKDITLSTNNAIQINIRGELKGEVTVKTPNADIKNSGTIGTLVVENAKNTTVKNTSAGKISKVEISSSSSNVKLENDGKITNVENNASGTEIENYGTISNPVTGTVKPEVDGNKPEGGTTGTVIPSIDQGKVNLVNAAKAAKDYKYEGNTENNEKPYTYTGEIRVTGTESANVVIAGPYKKENIEAVQSDMARYLGALHRVDNGATISAIKYNGKEYTWDNKGTLKGSNWKTGDKTLVSSIVSDLLKGLTEDTKEKSINLTLIGKNRKEVSMKMTLKQEFAVEAGGKMYATLQEAIDENENVKLLKNITLSEKIELNSGENTIIDLNKKTLTSTATKTKAFDTISGNKKLTIKNGSLKTSSKSPITSSIYVTKGCSVTLDNVKYTTEGTGILVEGDAALVNVINSEINTNGYGISTNAASKDNHNVTIELEKSKINSIDGVSVGTPILVNVPSTFNMTDCEIKGLYQGVIIRGGNATIKNTIIRNNAKLSYSFDYVDGDWKTGNEVPKAALVVGNRGSSSYQYPTTVNISNSCQIIDETTNSKPAVYIWGNKDEENKATLKYDQSTIIKGTIIKGEGCCTIEGHFPVQTETTK